MSDKEVIKCGTCGAKNRVEREKIEKGNNPVCGRCKSPLTVSNTGRDTVTVTDSTFSSEVERSALPVLLDMWAPWCGPCKMIAPVLEELASELAGRVRVAKMNVDENQITASRFNVRSIPTLLVLKSGKEVDRLVGVMPKVAIKQRLERVMDQRA